jgi:hypothetical protein
MSIYMYLEMYSKGKVKLVKKFFYESDADQYDSRKFIMIIIMVDEYEIGYPFIICGLLQLCRRLHRNIAFNYSFYCVFMMLL